MAVSSEIDKFIVIPEDTVLILGGGPVGLMTAAVLAFHGVRSVVLERNDEPTKWPKMDLTNARSMELIERIGLAEELRSQGVPGHIPYTVLISSGLSQDDPVARWDHPSVNTYKQSIKARNDGTQPLEPYQRISQRIFETWMRDRCHQSTMIDLHYGHKLESIKETVDGVEARVAVEVTGKTMDFRAKYAVGSDGASSRCRKDLGIDLDGGPLPISFLLVHFRSRNLSKLHKQGRFWHLFMLKNGGFGGAVISQDEKEIFTVHYPLPTGSDGSSVNSEDAVYSVLGGMYDPFRIQIDEILVRSIYQPSIAVAERFSGPLHHLFLAGDSAHQNIPTGGYGMNTGLGDAFDIAWKLAAVIRGYGGSGLLRSYEQERKPVARQNVERSGIHMSVHLKAVELLGDNPTEIDKSSEQGSCLRKAVSEYYTANDGENTDLGIEMGYRYKSSICIPDESETEPAWDPHTYLPTTWPGSRAPHVFLKNSSPIFSLMGKEFSLVEFREESSLDLGAKFFIEAARVLKIPLHRVTLTGEDHAANVWQKPLVLVRPDGHVAWRGENVANLSLARGVLMTITGKIDNRGA